jgi:hypothetical protein
MNDVEHDLRELFDRKASSVGGVAPRLPEHVRKRSRRRQLGTVIAGGLTAFAVLAGSVGLLRAIETDRDRQSTPADDPWAGYEVFARTAALQAFTITSPSDWYLVDQWSWSRPIAADMPRDERITPVLMLSNTDRGLMSSPCFDPAFAVGSEEAVMTIAADDAYSWEHRGQADALPQAPTRLDSGEFRDDGPCGSGTYLRFATEDHAFVAHLLFGDGVSEEDRTTLVQAFESMSARAAIDPTPIGTRRDHPTGAYVIAGGENAAGTWTLELRPQTNPGYLANVQLELETAEGTGTIAGGPFTVSEDRPIEQAGGDPVFGAVVKEADAVALRIEGGTPPIPAQLVPLPPSMPFGFDLFFASNDADVAPNAVPLGIDDPDVPTQGSSSLPTVAAEPETVAEGFTAGTPWALEFSDIPGKHTLVLRDMRGGSVLARLGPASLNRVHTSGLEFVPEAIPGGSVLIFGVAAPAATRLAIALDHGSITYLENGDPRWDPLPILTSTGEAGLRLWWAELPIDVGDVVTFSGRCEPLAHKRFIPDHAVRPIPEGEIDPRIRCDPN